jgi:hypothetical protein
MRLRDAGGAEEHKRKKPDAAARRNKLWVIK